MAAEEIPEQSKPKYFKNPAECCHIKHDDRFSFRLNDARGFQIAMLEHEHDCQSLLMTSKNAITLCFT